MAGRRVLVTGAGGFIGHHLVSFLRREGYWVRGVDLKLPEFCRTEAHEFDLLDLRLWNDCLRATAGISEVYALAADMGGMGFISHNHADILRNNELINLCTVEAARQNGANRYLFSSSACVYPEYRQTDANCAGLKEEDAYPAAPQDAYGWEKLLAEIRCTHYREEYGLQTRIVRFHNIFGPKGAWQGGREKVPAALCRKIAYAKLSGSNEIAIWGDGEQTRSFCYVDDCILGLYKLMRSDYPYPLNLGQDRMVSINHLADIIAGISGVAIEKTHVKGPVGVRGRNSDNTRVYQILGWEPKVSLEEGLARTYSWIEEPVRTNLAASRIGANPALNIGGAVAR